ncbi:hypothetical protein CASFOL_005391 [Castilleja foliolosa]|uniref:NAC domain-containing protein n=1 Tax=Castilleja foliolosa TaxID=1961234 RepID=A0ABD3E3B5_9LAMI
MNFKFLILALTISTTTLFSPITGQITAPCTPSMITTFSPCMSFVANNSTFNGSTPPADCCNSLNSLMTNGKECLCLIATGSVPFKIPINRTLAISLPRSCNMPGVPLQCKTTGAPAPSPGTIANGPSVSPNAAPSPSVQELAPPEPLSPQSGPGADATQSPPDVTTASGVPATSNTGSRAGVTPSAAARPSYSDSYLRVMMAVLGAIAFKYSMERLLEDIIMINEVNIYEHHPHYLAEIESIRKGSPTVNREVGDVGFWKATEVDKAIELNGEMIGRKKTLVFYTGEPRTGVANKTNWTMDEYLLNVPSTSPNSKHMSWMTVSCAESTKHSNKIQTVGEEFENTTSEEEDVNNLGGKNPILSYILYN